MPENQFVSLHGIHRSRLNFFYEPFGTYLTDRGKKLAVLAIDPSSERSGGSILGDKTRMETLASQPGAFIRPSPSAGTLGGVARKTRESIYLCEAAGYDIVLVETVGVGQSETAVHSMVDFFLLLLLAGAGDELQGIKRGIMEMADMLVVTKADGSNIENARRAAAQFQSALHLFPMPDSKWIRGSADLFCQRRQGIDQIWNEIQGYHKHAINNGYFIFRRKKQSLYWMNETIEEGLKNNFYKHDEIDTLLNKLREDVLHDKISSFAAAQKVLEFYFRHK
jgi:LAO/AO transport system kinase